MGKVLTEVGCDERQRRGNNRHVESLEREGSHKTEEDLEPVFAPPLLLGQLLGREFFLGRLFAVLGVGHGRSRVRYGAAAYGLFSGDGRIAVHRDRISRLGKAFLLALVVLFLCVLVCHIHGGG